MSLIDVLKCVDLLPLCDDLTKIIKHKIYQLNENINETIFGKMNQINYKNIYDAAGCLYSWKVYRIAIKVNIVNIVRWHLSRSRHLHFYLIPHNNIDVVKYLHINGVDIHYENDMLYKWALKVKDTKLIKYLQQFLHETHGHNAMSFHYKCINDPNPKIYKCIHKMYGEYGFECSCIRY
jgi:hypothetical protein